MALVPSVPVPSRTLKSQVLNVPKGANAKGTLPKDHFCAYPKEGTPREENKVTVAETHRYCDSSIERHGSTMIRSQTSVFVTCRGDLDIRCAGM